MKTIESLTKAIGSHVRLVNETNDNPEAGKISFQVHGKLELDSDDSGYYVRISEDPQGHGCNGVSFYSVNVSECFRQPSGITVIILKG